jgi:uncharacterized protein (TIGR02145 family)
MLGKRVFLILLILISFCLWNCQKEEATPEPIVLSCIIKNVSSYGGNDGSIDLTVSGGTQPYSYIWSNYSTTEDIDSLVAGTYIVTVCDIHNCTLTGTFIVTQPELNNIIIDYVINYPSALGANDGSIDITITGGNPPYHCLWSNGSTLEDQYNLEADLYTVTVTDQKEQTVSISVSLYEDIITDFDGNIYTTVKIGDQLWMKENLKVTHAPDGTPITSYAFNDNISNVEVYGRLYTWDIAMNNSIAEKSQGICPCGWHIPSDEEFKTLEIFLGMTQNEADMVNTWRGDSVGTKLKIGGSSGYDALLSGRRSASGQYSLKGIYEYIWTSTEYGDNAWRRCLDLNSDKSGRYNTFPKSYGFSIRCIKDD